MANQQAAGKKNSGKNATTSDHRLAKYLRYKQMHGNKQRNHSPSHTRSPLVRTTQRNIQIDKYTAAYKKAIRDNDEVMPELPLSRETKRMIGELKAVGNYPMHSREGKLGNRR
jgi:hypothetical protein